MLKSVTDGLGRQVEVDYTRVSEGFGTGAICAWPHRCVRKLDFAAVSTRTDSHFLNRARTLRTVLRNYSYAYDGAAADMAGYGWFGFRKRIVTEKDALGVDLRTTTVTYKSPPRWTPMLGFTPYVYTTSGQVESIEVRLPATGSRVSGAEIRMTTTSMEWEEGFSQSGGTRSARP
jgi:hypothetical protein